MDEESMFTCPLLTRKLSIQPCLTILIHSGHFPRQVIFMLCTYVGDENVTVTT